MDAKYLFKASIPEMQILQIACVFLVRHWLSSTAGTAWLVAPLTGPAALAYYSFPVAAPICSIAFCNILIGSFVNMVRQPNEFC
jgi:hypothetical protein